MTRRPLRVPIEWAGPGKTSGTGWTMCDYVFGSLQGREVLPGEYQVRLRAGGKTLTEPLTVRMDPRVTTPLSELQSQDDLVVWCPSAPGVRAMMSPRCAAQAAG